MVPLHDASFSLVCSDVKKTGEVLEGLEEIEKLNNIPVTQGQFLEAAFKVSQRVFVPHTEVLGVLDVRASDRR